MHQALRILFSGLLLVVAVGVGALSVRSIGPPDFGVRVIGRTNDTTGQLQVIYEVTDRSYSTRLEQRDIHLG
jgi:hypothetical protein